MSKSHQSRRGIDRNPIAVVTSMLFALFILAADAAAEEESQKPAKLFSTDETLEVTLKAPWRRLLRDEKNQDAYPAQIEYRDSSGAGGPMEITVGRRGVKRQEACTFPPIRLRMEKDEVKGTAFRGETSLKMVTHCENSSRYDQYYILEMLAYRIYNLVTDYSFRVRPLDVTYVDSDTGKTEDPRFAFLIEDDSDVAKRNGIKKLSIPRIRPNRLDPYQGSLMALFQYMIGNVDWAALIGPDPEECCHNVKLIGPEPLQDGDLAVAVPYDFDSSGLVDAPYAAPHESLPIRSVKQRLYRGYCVHNTSLEDARQRILSQKSAILALIEQESRLNSSPKKKALRYLDDFFETIEDDKDFDDDIIQQCRK